MPNESRWQQFWNLVTRTNAGWSLADRIINLFTSGAESIAMSWLVQFGPRLLMGLAFFAVFYVGQLSLIYYWRRGRLWPSQDSESLLSIAVAWKSARADQRHKLLCDRFPLWPAIAAAAPIAVGFQEWDEAAWDKLANWLVAHGHAEERSAALLLPARRVAALLERAARRTKT